VKVGEPHRTCPATKPSKEEGSGHLGGSGQGGRSLETTGPLSMTKGKDFGGP
jgi:hypothetical protein